MEIDAAKHLHGLVQVQTGGRTLHNRVSCTFNLQLVMLTTRQARL